VGCSGYKIDLAVVDPVNPGCYLLGIECDGTTYKSSCSARDRDRLREQVLRNLGWRIHRVWSPAWVARRDSEVARLKEAIERASKISLEKEAAAPILEDIEEPQNEIQKTKFAGLETIGEPYKIHPIKAIYEPYINRRGKSGISKAKNEYYFPENRALQTRLLLELVEKEGPLHFDYAVQRLAGAWSLKRVTPKIVASAKESLTLLIRDRKVVLKGSFIWPTASNTVPIRVPVAGVPESKRKPEHIPPEEIEATMITIAKYALSISEASLIAETAKVFGANHITEQTKQAFNETLKRLVKERKLASKDNMVTVV
jgi:hypothetical protein